VRRTCDDLTNSSASGQFLPVTNGGFRCPILARCSDTETCMTQTGRFLVFTLSCSLLVATAAADEPGGRLTRLIEVNGSRLHVEREGSGPPLLFLHGGLQFFANDFAAERAVFATSRTVVGIDQRGHGHSPDDARPFSYQAMADDTAAVLKKLGFAKVDIVGESDGGDVGLLLARDHPELVRRLVVTGANLRSGVPAEEAARRQAWSDAQISERTRLLEAQLPSRFRSEYEAVSPDGPGHWQTLLIKSYRLWMTPVILEPDSLKTIEVPVLVIAGDHDFASVEETTEIFRGLPKGQLMIVPAAGHGTFRDRPALMTLAVREFLDAPSK
jgi:pimeloyl-ACP methyl ester carboxylesterase